ncbi:hypothetical protein MCOR12_001214 [Pyricularia oryzae]|nr:hypothetical protein MCOR12_001214 [Pyricularia oryzae]
MSKLYVDEAFKQIGDRIPFTKHLDMAACSRSAWQGRLFTSDASDDKTASEFVKLFELSQASCTIVARARSKS